MQTVTDTTVALALQAAIQRLQAAGCNTPRLDAELLLAHVLGQSRTWLCMYPLAPLKPEQLEMFTSLVAQREQRRPVAYLTGHKEFFALDFVVNSAVLIPRPETELLVEKALCWAAPERPLSIVDVGTGSGCIAVSLASHLSLARLFAVELSQPALRLAQKNADRHAVSDRITFLHGDLLTPLDQPVDLIVSNPPYLQQAALHSKGVMPEVRCYEPAAALDGGPTGLEVIERLLAQAPQKLRPGGAIMIEIGAGQALSAIELARTYFPKAAIQVKQDLAGLDRLLVVQNSW